MPKRILSGVVVSSNSNKTIVVDVTRRIKHKLYKKIIRQTKKYHAHDENNEFNIGDTVSIIESKPISKLKKWRVVSGTGNNSWSKCSLNFLLQIIQAQDQYNV